jgi:hypothetical protein
MRAVSGDDIARVPAGKGTFVSRKYDGEFAFVVFDGENVISLHPSGTVRSGLPCLEEAAKSLKKAKVKSCILGAEYYLLDTAAETRSLEQVLGVLRNPSSKKELDRLALGVFDVVEVEGKPVNTTEALPISINGSAKAERSSGRAQVGDKERDDHGDLSRLGRRRGPEGIVVRNDKGTITR